MKDGEIKNKLSPAQVSVMLHRVTEPPYFGKYWDTFIGGTYVCAACETPLFSSDEKFDSKTGWPSFKKPINERDLQFKSEPGPDDKVEVRCKKCKSHLGYVIAGDAPYYRINSVCMIFKPTPEKTVIAKKEPEQKPAPVAELPIPIQPTAPWDRQSMAIGALLGIILGLIIGIVATTWHLKPVTPVQETASSMVDIASSTDETTSTPEATPKKSTTPIATPQTTPETTQEPPNPAPDTATSTQ